MLAEETKGPLPGLLGCCFGGDVLAVVVEEGVGDSRLDVAVDLMAYLEDLVFKHAGRVR